MHPTVRRRVVLVDDDRGYVAALTALLDYEHAYEVVGTARDGREAIDVVSGTAPDVVVMDIDMPVMDGVEATRVLTSRTSAPTILLVSGDEDERVEAGLAAGAFAFVRKGDVPSRLVAVLTAATAAVSA